MEATVERLREEIKELLTERDALLSGNLTLYEKRYEDCDLIFKKCPFSLKRARGQFSLFS